MNVFHYHPDPLSKPEGMHNEAWSAILAAGTAGRHNARVRALVAWANEDQAQAVMAMMLDQIGVGGVAGLTGESTLRHPWLAGAGKGRKHARDGQAWTRAIASAMSAILDGGRSIITPAGLLTHLEACPQAREWVLTAAILGSWEAYEPKGGRHDLRHIRFFSEGLADWARVIDAILAMDPLPNSESEEPT